MSAPKKHSEEWYADKWKALADVRTRWEENAMRDHGWSKQVAESCENAERVILRDILESPKYRAAPDMLVALKKVDGIARTLMDEHSSNKRGPATDWGIVNDGLCEIARAISKAEGTHAKD